MSTLAMDEELCTLAVALPDKHSYCLPRAKSEGLFLLVLVQGLERCPPTSRIWPGSHLSTPTTDTPFLRHRVSGSHPPCFCVFWF